MIMAQGFLNGGRSENVVSRVACGVYHFNPCSQTTVKRKENTKAKQKHLVPIVLVLVVLGLRQKFAVP